MKIFSTYPSPVRLSIGFREFIGIYDPEQIKIVLTSPQAIEKDEYYLKFGHLWVGTGLFTAPASKWRIHRKLIQPSFNLKVLQSSVEVFRKHANILIEKLSEKVNGTEFQPLHYLSLCTLNIIIESVMGVSTWSENESNVYLKAAERANGALTERIFKVWLHHDLIFNLTKELKIFRESVECLHDIRNRIIRKKRKELDSESTKTDLAPGEKKTFLDLLIELSDNQKKITDAELQHEVDTFMFGGQDTSANTMCFGLLMLASYPNIQNKIYEELYGLYGSEDPKDVPVKYEDLPKLEYLERVLKETMRLFPVTPFFLRKITDDLKIGKYTLPKGCSAFLGIIKVHRDEKYWLNPLKFDPDRFLPEEVKKRHPLAFVPFSYGPRGCIGQSFAMMSMKVIMATILRKYVIKIDNIKSIKNIRLKLGMMLKPVEPIAIRIEERF